jgi:hypothetical protein
MLPGFEAVDRRDLREAIVLLYKLNNTPEQPSENSIDDYIARADALQGRLLPAVREKQLVETLAFLASASDNPRKVASLCIEENPDQRGLTIKLAANHGDLSSVKRGFEDMAKILQRVARRGGCFSDFPDITC